MKIPVSELEGERLDKWVALVQELDVVIKHGVQCVVVEFDPDNPWFDYDIVEQKSYIIYRPSTDGGQAMELVKEHGICVRPSVTVNGKVAAWAAEWVFPMKNNHKGYAGTTPEIAICRAVVAAKFGEYVEEEEQC